MRTSALILAAGRSERMASLGMKPLLPFRKKTFIECIHEKIIDAGFQPVVIITNFNLHHDIHVLSLRAEIIVNPHPELGMLSSLRLGIERLNSASSGFLLQPVDFPLVKTDTYKRLKEAHEKSPDQIIRPAYGSQSGHPVIFPANVFDDFRMAPLAQGARYIINKYSHCIIDIDVDDPGILVNINTPELYFEHCS